ncbi:MAG: APC family permease [Nitrososphaerota archaeon]|nr:APC family permease [Nitrososphaerota archaeon]MDG6990727.1 APC family permease [Nitrososphaerota archaeon]
MAAESEGGKEGLGGVFLRDATGIVKELSARDVFAWTVVFFPWLTSWAGIFWVTPDFYQNVDYYAGLAVWGVIALVIVVLYWQLTSIMPKTGGDYVFISRILSSPVGFVASFLFFVSLLISAGSGSYWAFTEAGTQLSFSGLVLGNQWMASLGASMTPGAAASPWTLMAGGIAILALGTLVVVLGGKVLKYIIFAFFGTGAVAMAIVLVVFLTSSSSQFAAAYASHFSGGVGAVMAQAAAKGYSPGASLSSLSAVVPLLFVSIGPYPVMQLVGGELKKPRRTLLYGLVLAEVVSIAAWFGLTYLLDTRVGISFIEAWTVTNGYSATVPTAFATVLNGNPYLLWFLVFALFVGNIGWSWLALAFISRLFLAWSFDRIIPAKFASVSERFHTPAVAIVFTAALAAVPMYLQYFTSFITTQVNAIFFYSIVWFLAALSAILLPLTRKDIYRAAGGKAGRVPMISLLGALAAALFAYLGYNSVANPAIGPFSGAAELFTALVVAIPAAVYAFSYWFNRRRGIDLSRLHSELPPD